MIIGCAGGHRHSHCDGFDRLHARARRSSMPPCPRPTLPSGRSIPSLRR
jgi:hypothetical protein